MKKPDLQSIELPKPAFIKGQTVFKALKKRCTTRTLRPDPIPLQLLADILWAAQGVNRRPGPFGITGRTAGSASNSQEVLVYVAMQEGTYLYEPETRRLTPAAGGDNRLLAIGAGQNRGGRAGNAPVRLIYVVDLDKFKTAGFQEPGLWDAEVQKSYYFVDTGLIAQNVYMATAALGLAAWFHNCNKPAVSKKLRLGPSQRALFGQSLGYAQE